MGLGRDAPQRPRLDPVPFYRTILPPAAALGHASPLPTHLAETHHFEHVLSTSVGASHRPPDSGESTPELSTPATL